MRTVQGLVNAVVLVEIYDKIHSWLTLLGAFDSYVHESRKSMHITARDADGVVVFYIEGEVCRSHAAKTTLHQVIKSQLELGKRNFLLNLGKVDSIDSFGVGEILASYTSIQNLGGKLKLTRIPARLITVFKVTWLDRVFEIFENETAALQSFAKS
jgi:anti-sigma B factor antagonist